MNRQIYACAKSDKRHFFQKIDRLVEYGPALQYDIKYKCAHSRLPWKHEIVSGNLSQYTIEGCVSVDVVAYITAFNSQGPCRLEPTRIVISQQTNGIYLFLKAHFRVYLFYIFFFFFSGLSCHLVSLVYMISFFLYFALFVVLSSFNPASVISLLHASFHLRFGRPLLLFPGMSSSSILLTMCSSFILFTWPYHFSRFSVLFLDAHILTLSYFRT